MYNKAASVRSCNSFDPCKPYIAPSILFLSVSAITVGAFVYFYVNLHPKRKLQDYYYKKEMRQSIRYVKHK